MGNIHVKYCNSGICRRGNGYLQFYAKNINRDVRVYGPHVYIYNPHKANKHSVNGWVPTQIPLNRINKGEL
jgi:hypothetical protein